MNRKKMRTKKYITVIPHAPFITMVALLLLCTGAAKAKDYTYHTGVVQCKDAFYGQHEPEKMPVGYELINKWNAWKMMGCLASEMESAALFIVAGKLRVRAGSCFLVVANQERESLGLENPVVRDTDMAIQVAVEAIRNLIKADQAEK